MINCDIQPVRVIFTYDGVSEKWVPSVTGATTPLEARQAFSATVITCQQLDPMLLNRTIVRLTGSVDGFAIIPVV